MTSFVLEGFCDSIRAAGLTPPAEIIADGKLHRFASNGKRDDDAGYYVLHGDGVPAGMFGDWRSGVSQTWRADIGRKLSFAEVEALRRKREADQQKLDEAERQRHAEARRKALALWKAGTPATVDNPYLTLKGVPPTDTLREIDADQAAAILGYQPKSRGELLRGRLLVVPVKVGDALSTTELIDGDKRKSALYGGVKTGGYWAAQPLPDGDGEGLLLLIGEGVATVLSAKEASGHPAIAALSAGNLLAVAKAMRERYPKARITILADLGNGEREAHAAARAVGGLVTIPDFGVDRPERATDFNDLHKHRGAEAVKRAVAAARAPGIDGHQPTAENATELDSHGGAEWPSAMDEAALHGIAGEFVRMVEPNTEADPAAVLVQFLVAFGALVGRGPHYKVEGDEHHANLYALLVGATAKGRKGTSWGRVREAFESILGWKPHVSGLSSGEGVKFHVRDPREETKPNKKGELVTEIVDEGVKDKRLFVVESEFASALRNAQKPGNTLSATIREGWDSGTLRTLTKNDPVTATGTHICIVGHITADELRAELTATDSANGFANRFLFVGVRRSKLLPFGGDKADEAEVKALSDRLRERAEAARTLHRIEMTDRTRSMWKGVYEALSAGSDGLHGAVTARAEAQVIRLALIYCLLDSEKVIDVAHLLAALAVWEYCDATAKYIFGASIGDKIADEIARRLQQAGEGGLTKTEISDVFKRHQPAERIGAALELLRVKGLATCEAVKTDGRPSEMWRAAK